MASSTPLPSEHPPAPSTMDPTAQPEPVPAYPLPTPALAVARASVGQQAPPLIARHPPTSATVLRATATPWVPLPQRVHTGRSRPSPQTVPHSDYPPAASPAEENATGPAGNPLESILRVLTEFLVTIAAGGNLQEAAMRALALLGRTHNG